MTALGFSRFRRTSVICALSLLWGAAGFAVGPVELISRLASPSLSDTAEDSQDRYGGTENPAPAVSRDGRYVAFLSVAGNLVSGQIDHDGGYLSSNDVFLYDGAARATTLVSHAAASPVTTGNESSFAPVISADGRWVAYPSWATNPVDGLGPVDYEARLFLWDRVTGATALVGPTVSGPAGASSPCAISADGRFVAYLQPNDDGGTDVFLWDRTSRQATRAGAAGLPGTTSAVLSLSADSRFVAFDRYDLGSGESTGAVFLYDRTSGAVTRVAAGFFPAISGDGGTIAYLAGGNLFLYSRAARTAVLASHAAGRPTAPANGVSGFSPDSHPLSDDGRYIAFTSNATNLVPGQVARDSSSLFLYDRGAGTVSLVSRAGGSAKNPSPYPLSATMSADGRLIVFRSNDPSLVPGPAGPGGGDDVFLFDRKAARAVRVSGAGRGGAPHASGIYSYSPAMSADGSQIAFYSNASDLVPGLRDLNAGYDLFVYDTGQRASAVATRRAPAMASLTPLADSFLRGLSADGRWVAFEGAGSGFVPGEADTNGQSDVHLRDRATLSTLLVSHAAGSPATAGNGASWQAVMSADGRWVAFTSNATSLDATVTSQHRSDVYLYDRATGGTVALSRSARHPGSTGDGDSQLPAISADGRWVAFTSRADDLAPATGTATGNVYLYDRAAGVLQRTGAAAGAQDLAKPYTLSADGRYLAVLTPGPRQYDVYLYDRVTGTQALVSHAPDGSAAGAVPNETPALSADGRFVAFTSYRSDLGGAPGGEVNVYLWDRETGVVTLAGPSDRVGPGAQPRSPRLSADGRWLAFLSNQDLVSRPAGSPGGLEVYLYDRVAGTLTLVGPSAGLLRISADGRYVANGRYLYDRVFGATGALAAPLVDDLLLSADGGTIAFQSRNSNLAPGDFNSSRADVFAFRLAP